jgi:hypothetical protein
MNLGRTIKTTTAMFGQSGGFPSAQSFQNPTATLASARNQDRQLGPTGEIPGLSMAQNLLGNSGGMSPGSIMNFGRNAARKTLAAKNTLMPGMGGGQGGAVGDMAAVAANQLKKMIIREILLITLPVVAELLLILCLIIIIVVTFSSAYNSLAELIRIF